MPAIPTHDTAVVDEPWDAGTQVDKIKEPVSKTVGDDEFAWVEAGDSDNKADWSFPHHLVADDGTPGAAVKSALDNGLARLNQADIPQADQAGVRTHLQHHLDAFNRKQAAARAEAFAASVVDEPATDVVEQPTEPTATASGYSDMDYLRSAHSNVELLLGKPWAITHEAAIEVASRLTLQAQGQFRVDEQLARLQAAARQPLKPHKAADGTDVAVIPLRGTITPRGSLFSLLFGGGGGLQMFVEQFRMAMADGNVSAIVLDIDSPGGVIDMVPEAAAEIFGARGQKPITAVANTTCASAAYWIASAADTVVATPSAQVGSIGVFVTHEDISRMAASMGVDVSVISAGPYKTERNPYEPLSKGAKAALQAQVNTLYGMFTGDVARGRGTSQAAIQAGYGQGRCLLASDALRVGMVDRIDTLERVVAQLGGARTSAADPAPQPGDLEDCPDEPEATATAAPKTSPTAESLAVSAPPVDYLSPQSTRSRLI